jgi:tetratricopeptide (TPR) repeat protein
MANVSLRIYNREIETLVESGQLDEAIAHCRHILNVYPKHLETYRMIGKAYLEAKRYDEATDIFERILMAVPDDFVAHVGMSIIRDEQKSMDDAIWYMQRAFEVQPSNSAIQAELQRLYGRRDGIEPPKIRLTRGALAHMYVQGELYPQAISEINGVLEEDPERQDMQILLARAYFYAGQQSEAAEMCSQLLRRYPYCFDANRVLVELLPQTERGESVQVYRNRVNELDPYAAFVTGSVFHTEEVPEVAVSLEQLEWNGQPVDVQPEWSDSLGIGRGEETAASDAEPDWLKTDLSSGSFAASGSTEEPASAPGSLPVPSAGGEDEIPEFLRDAGWGEDTGTFQEGASFLDATDDSSEEPAIVEGDLPDWVKAMAPTGADTEDAAPQSEPLEDLTQDDVPDWLQGLGDAQSMPAAEQPLADADVPDWLESMQPSDETESPAQEQPQEQSLTEPASDDDLPDWLKPVQSEEDQAASQEVPQEPVQESSQEPVQETPGMSDESLSNWQIGDEAPAGPVDFDKTDTGALGTSAEEQDDAVAWLESLASKHGAKPEELVTDPEARKETAPDWVQKAQSMQEQGQTEASAPQEMPPVAEEPVQPVEQAAPVSADDLGTSAEEQDDAVAWLEGLASKHGANPEELVTDPDARTETAPDWVQKAQSLKEQGQAEEPSQPVEETVAPAAPVSADDLGTSAEEQDDAVAWLEGLASKHGAKPEELVTDPNARSETAPEWVQKATEAGSENAIGERPTAPPAGEAAEGEPDWMKEAKEVGESLYDELEEAQTKEPLPAADSDETGMWLRDLGEEGSFAEEQAEQPAAEGDIPDWLSGLDAEDATPEAAAETEIVAEIGSAPETEAAPEPAEEAEPEPPDWLQSMEADVSETAAAPTSQEDATLPDWLSDIESGPSETEGIPVPSSEEEAVLESSQEAPEAEATAPADEASITDWLQNVASESSEAEAGEPSAETVEETEADDLPSWLAGLDADADAEQSQPEAGSDADLPEWLRAETESEPPARAEPTAPTDWKPVDVTPPEPPISTPEPEPEVEAPPVQAAPPPASKPEPEPTPEPPTPPAREPYREPVTRSRTGMTGMLSAAQDPGLTEAQNELTRGNIPGAMEKYGKLIKKGKLLEEIIFDLREALYRYPVEVAILQSLGDAYMRANRLQEALDSYTKAEELLR